MREHRPDHPIRVRALLGPTRLVGDEVWVRADGDELVIVADSPDLGVATVNGLTEVARHRLSTPGNPRIDLSHYPDHPQEPDGSP
jgi:hypothetical protein